MDGTPAEELPPRARVLAECLLDEMHAGTGDWTLILVGKDGRLRKWKATQEGGAESLRQFERAKEE